MAETKYETSDPILNLVLNRHQQANTYRQEYENKWDTIYRMYRFKLKSEAKVGRSNFYIPQAFSNVETVYPRMIAKAPNIIIKPRTELDVDKVKVINSLVEFCWESLSISEIIKRWVKGALIYGTGILKISWQKEIVDKESEKTELDKDGNVKDISSEKTKDVKYDNIKVSNVDIRDIFIDPNAVTIDEAKYIIHRYFASKEELEGNPNYSKDDLEKIVYGASNGKIARGMDEKAKEATKHSTEAEVFEYWEDYKLIIVAGGQVIRNSSNPYKLCKKPFISMVDQIDDQTFYGIGEVEPIEGLQNELNTLRNQRMDFNNIVLNPVWKVKQGSVQDLDTVQFTPNYKISVLGDTDAVTPVTMPNTPQSSYKEEESIRLDLQQVTGVSDYARGSEGSKLNDTATGISLIQEAANQRFNSKVQNMEDGLVRLNKWIIALYQQFLPKDMIVRITDKEDSYDFLKVNKADISGQFDIIVRSGSTVPANKMQAKTEAMNTYNVLSANPLIASNPQALLEITRSLLDSIEDPNKDKVLKALEDQIQQQKLEEKARMQAEEEIAAEEQAMADEEQMMADEQQGADDEDEETAQELARMMINNGGEGGETIPTQ